MKLLRLTVFLALGFICSSLFIFFLGEKGLAEYRLLLGYREVLQENILELEAVNQRLLEELEALRSDSEAVTLQARELGYYREGERVVRIESYAPEGASYTIGKIIRRRPGPSPKRWLFHLPALMIALLLSLPSLLKRTKAGRPVRGSYAGRH